MSFHEVRFPASLSLGSLGGPERRTRVVEMSNGAEQRSTAWAHARRRYDAGLGMRSLDDLSDLVAFFEARQGRLFGFRWKDWADFKSCRPSATPAFDDQEIGVGDGVERMFSLSRAYRSGAQCIWRRIAKPVPGSVRLGVSGQPLTEGVHYEVDHASGIVTLAAAPGTGAVVTAGFEFDVPVRFDTDRIAVSVASFQAGDVPTVPVVEVRP